MTEREVAPPRIVIRHTSVLMVRTTVAHTRPHRGDLLEAFMFRLMYSANVAHIPLDSAEAGIASPGLDFDPALLRPTSISALSKSIGVAFETVRSKIKRLIDSGHCVQVDAGFVVRPASMLQPEMAIVLAEVHQLFIDTLVGLQRLGWHVDSLCQTNGDPQEPPHASLVTRVLIDFEVRQLQHLSTSFFGNSLRAFLWSAVLSANLAHLLTDREAAWRHARDPVPDAQRRPISIRSLADQIEQPYETVRRHIRAMVAAGALVDANGGVIVPRPLNPQPAWELYNERLLTAFGRMIGDLTRIGFRMPPS